MTPSELLRLAINEPDRLERALELAREIRTFTGDTEFLGVNVDQSAQPVAPTVRGGAGTGPNPARLNHQEDREAPDSASDDDDYATIKKPKSSTGSVTAPHDPNLCVENKSPAAPTPTAAAEPGGELPQAEPSGSPPGDSPDPGPIPDFLDRRKEA